MNAQIIPVLDLWQGTVVHARAGRRVEYKAIQSRLCEGSAPLTVLHALLERYHFKQCYLADLNALQYQAPQQALIQSLAQQFPEVEFYLDSGIRNLAGYIAWQAAYRHYRMRPIFGSETLESFATYQQLHQVADNCLLSLDFFHGKFLGDPEILAHPETWANTVILLNLHRVGTQTGIDIAQLRDLQNRAPQCAWIAAGGVRQIADIHALAACGIAGVLVATALHDLSLESEIAIPR